MYSVTLEEKGCSEDCEIFRECVCSQCLCCSYCSTACPCMWAEKDPERKLASLLNLFLADYTYVNFVLHCILSNYLHRFVKTITANYTAMEDEESGDDEPDINLILALKVIRKYTQKSSMATEVIMSLRNIE